VPTFRAYPLTFVPQLEERVWGGRNLERYRKSLPAGVPIGESWEISDVEGKPSRAASGAYQGESLRWLLDLFPREILGEDSAQWGGEPRFPLLLKLLDAEQDLSVQVHPADEDLRRRGESGSGKTEAWILLATRPGARIVHGLPAGSRRRDVYARLEALGGTRLPPEEEETLFRWVPVEPGDVVFVPAGTIHAVGKSIVLLEVQQTSDTTYRIYDWGRPGLDGRPRALHLLQAGGIAEPLTVPCPLASLRQAATAAGFSLLLACDKFQVEGLAFEAGGGAASVRASTREGGPAGFHILAGVEGAVRCSVPSGDEIELRPGEFTLLPAALGDYKVERIEAPARIARFRGPAAGPIMARNPGGRQWQAPEDRIRDAR